MDTPTNFPMPKVIAAAASPNIPPGCRKSSEGTLVTLDGRRPFDLPYIIRSSLNFSFSLS